jgi:hypothetical protein
MFGTNYNAFSNFGNTPTPATNIRSKKYFKDNKITGLYRNVDPKTGKLTEEGNFRDGV